MRASSGRQYFDRKIAEGKTRHPGPRHAAGWYDQSGEKTVLAEGDRMFIACEGGPCTSRLETFPPRLEVDERTGIYVLDDTSPQERRRYIFVSRPA